MAFEKLQNSRNALGIVFMLPAAVLLLLFLTYPLGLGAWLVATLVHAADDPTSRRVKRRRVGPRVHGPLTTLPAPAMTRRAESIGLRPIDITLPAP